MAKKTEEVMSTEETTQELVVIEATYKEGDTAREMVVNYDFGGNVEGAVSKFGADVVYSNFVRAAKITAQAVMRRLAEGGKSDEEIADTMAAWKPGVQLERTVDPVAAMLKKFGSMDAEAQAKFIADLQAKANR